MQDSLQLKPTAHTAWDFSKEFDPTHVRSLLNDTVEVSLTKGPDGLLGDDVPYRFGNDNSITIVLLSCFMLSMIAISFSRSFLVRQIRDCFYTPRSGATMTETGYESALQVFLVLLTAIVGGIFCCIVSESWGTGTFMQGSQLKVIGAFTAVFLAYFIFKRIVFGIVDWVFFSSKNNDRWIETLVFLTAAEGILLFPMMLLQVYFDISLQATVIYALCIIILVKLLSFYKSYSIFFKRGRQYVQNILYFCALELVPLLALAGILRITGNYLKVIF